MTKSRRREISRNWSRRNRKQRVAYEKEWLKNPVNYQLKLKWAREWKARNEEKIKAYRAAYYKKNIDKERKTNRAWIAKNKTAHLLLKKAWTKKNSAYIKERMRQYRANPINKRRRRKRENSRYKNDIRYAIECRLRASLLQAIRLYGRVKCANTRDLVGCSIDELIKHIESKFQPGMNWTRRSEIHIDHIRPCSAFDLTKASEQRRCFHYTNLQPLWAVDNLRKQNKIIF